MVAEVGYGPAGSDPLDPSSGWAWAVTYPDPTWSDNEAPGEDRWAGPLVVYEAGQWNVAMRASVDFGVTWVLCDHDGAANGYDPAEAGHLTVGEGVCVPNPCTAPPEPSCEGSLLTVFEPVGTCALVGEPFEADCSYGASLFDCAPYGGCVDGGCAEVPEAPQAFGELVISEVLRDSVFGPPDEGEWVEVYNPGPVALDLRGCHLGDAALVIEGAAPVAVPAGGYGVIRSSASATSGPSATAVIPSLALGNVAGQITLTCEQGIIDDIAYTLGWPGQEGVAMQVDAGVLAGDAPAIMNNALDAWCAGTEPYGTDGALGTPGGPNTACASSED